MCGVGDDVCQNGGVMRGSADEVCEVRYRMRVNGDEPQAGGHETRTSGEAGVRWAAVPARLSEGAQRAWAAVLKLEASLVVEGSVSAF